MAGNPIQCRWSRQVSGRINRRDLPYRSSRTPRFCLTDPHARPQPAPRAMRLGLSPSRFRWSLHSSAGVGGCDPPVPRIAGSSPLSRPSPHRPADEFLVRRNRRGGPPDSVDRAMSGHAADTAIQATRAYRPPHPGLADRGTGRRPTPPAQRLHIDPSLRSKADALRCGTASIHRSSALPSRRSGRGLGGFVLDRSRAIVAVLIGAALFSRWLLRRRLLGPNVARGRAAVIAYRRVARPLRTGAVT